MHYFFNLEKENGLFHFYKKGNLKWQNSENKMYTYYYKITHGICPSGFSHDGGECTTRFIASCYITVCLSVIGTTKSHLLFSKENVTLNKVLFTVTL